MKYIRLFIWIIGILLAVIAPVQLYRIHRAFGHLQLGEILIFVLPPFLLIGTAYMLKRKLKNGLIHGLGFAALIGISLYYVLLSLGLEMMMLTRPVTEVRKYEKTLHKWQEIAPDIVCHFPDPIPSDAREVEFYFFPGFMQADSQLQLKYKTTPEKIDEYYKEYSEIKTKSYYGETLVHYLSHKKERQIIELGKDFEVLQFDKDPNRIHEHGVIISREKNEIIFWAEW